MTSIKLISVLLDADNSAIYILVTQFGKNFEDKRVNNQLEHQTTTGLNCS